MGAIIAFFGLCALCVAAVRKHFILIFQYITHFYKTRSWFYDTVSM